MLKIKHCRSAAILAIILSILALFASTVSILNKNIYEGALSTGLFSRILIPGTFSQDIISIPSSLALLVSAVFFLKYPAPKVFIALLGLTAYFFYAYGLFVISGLFTSLYLVYLIIFGISIYILIYGLTGFKMKEVSHYRLPRKIRNSIGVFLLLMVALFIPMWIIALMPYTVNNLQPHAYAVYVLDICVVLPALALIGIMLLRNKSFGNVLCGVALIKTSTLILSVTIGESLASSYGFQVNYLMIAVYGVVTVFSIVLIVLYMINFKKENIQIIY